jgi:hypothetical protein
VSFLLSAVPVLVVAGNTATPAVVFTVYACLGALPTPTCAGPTGGRDAC